MIRNGADSISSGTVAKAPALGPALQHAEARQSAGGELIAGGAQGRRRQNRAQAQATSARIATAFRPQRNQQKRPCWQRPRAPRQPILNERLTAASQIRPRCAWHNHLRFAGAVWPYLTQQRRAHRKRHRRPQSAAAPLLVFAAVTVAAACYVAYVLWPRWPDAPVALNAPSLPIVCRGREFQHRAGGDPRGDRAPSRHAAAR